MPDGVLHVQTSHDVADRGAHSILSEVECSGQGSSSTDPKVSFRSLSKTTNGKDDPTQLREALAEEQQVLQEMEDRVFVPLSCALICSAMRKGYRVLFGILILCVSVGVATWRAHHFWQEEKVEERNQIFRAAFDVAAKLSTQVRTSASSVYTMAKIAEIDGGVFLDNNFETIASTVLKEYRGISNFDIAPYGVVKYKVPLKGNEGAIGHAMLSDHRRIDATLVTIRERKLLLDGPLALIQGGHAVIGRYPVFTRFSPVTIPDIYAWWPSWNHTCCNTSMPIPGYGAESLPGPAAADGQPTFFWGLVEFVTKVDKLVEDLNLPDAAKTMQYQFSNRRKHASMPTPVFLQSDGVSPTTQFDNPVVIPISLPDIGIDWEFIAIPVNGWRTWSAFFVLTLLSLYIGFAVSLVSVTLMEARRLQIETARKLLAARAKKVHTFYKSRSTLQLMPNEVI
uniref:CHASE domain-containing protein n=1 Tax=Eutreptiella gymnastica TaxID=73025 RepID=A0A7S1NQH7_9EUGL